MIHGIINNAREKNIITVKKIIGFMAIKVRNFQSL
jgi:hypothetical protein